MYDVLMGRVDAAEGQQTTHVPGARSAAFALLLAFAILGALSGAAVADVGAGYRVKPLCAAPISPTAACSALRLVATAVPLSPPAASSQARAAGEAEASKAAEGMMPAAGFLTPADLHTAYALPAETSAAATQTVAVVDAFDDPTAEADLGVYDEQFKLPACTAANGCFRKVNEQGHPSPLPPEQGEWAGEISVDVQMVHAICQDCHILLVEAESAELSDLGAAVNAAVNAGASEISNSYHAPEEVVLGSFFEELEHEFYEHPGVVMTASSGDCGYDNQTCAGKGAGADFPASSPDVIGVGGTSLTSQHGVWSSTAWDEGGSGCSEIFAAPSWQSALAGFTATGCGAARSVADVAAVADPKTGVDIYDSTPEGEAPTGWTVFGGTSVSAPIVAAEFALAGGAHGVHVPAATLYAHAGQSGAFSDVVSGANGSCGGATECQAVVGYDGPTGLGSPLGLSAFAPPEPVENPVLKNFTPSSGITGSTVTLEGSGLGTVKEVDFGKLPASFKVLSSTQIQATVPNGASKGKIAVHSPTASATGKGSFVPTFSIVSFSPQQGAAGTSVTLKGVGFGAHSSVSFDGTLAQLKSASAKKIKVTVPAGAGTGPISVTNTQAPAGTVLSAGSFTP